jgi:hypothetical protein
MERYVSQREALEKAISITRSLLESTRNRDAQSSIEQALMYLGNVRSHLQGDYIRHKDPVLLMETNGTQVKI